MSDLRFRDAEDEMFALVNDYALNSAPAVIGIALQVSWPGVADSEEQIDKTKHWARVSTQVVLSRKVGFVANGIGGRDRNKHEVSGLIFVQLFAPRIPGAYNDAKDLADGLVSKFRKYRSATNLSFVNARPNPLDPEPNYYRVNVVSETEYEQLD